MQLQNKISFKHNHQLNVLDLHALELLKRLDQTVQKNVLLVLEMKLLDFCLQIVVDVLEIMFVNIGFILVINFSLNFFEIFHYYYFMFVFFYIIQSEKTNFRDPRHCSRFNRFRIKSLFINIDSFENRCRRISSHFGCSFCKSAKKKNERFLIHDFCFYLFFSLMDIWLLKLPQQFQMQRFSLSFQIPKKKNFLHNNQLLN